MKGKKINVLDFKEPLLKLPLLSSVHVDLFAGIHISVRLVTYITYYSKRVQIGIQILYQSPQIFLFYNFIYITFFIGIHFGCEYFLVKVSYDDRRTRRRNLYFERNYYSMSRYIM